MLELKQQINEREKELQRVIVVLPTPYNRSPYWY